MDSGSTDNKNSSRINAFFKWFSDEYERVYAVNLITGEYTLTYFNDSNYSAPLSGDFRTAFNTLAKTHVDKQFISDFTAMFCFENLKKVFSENPDARLQLRYMGSYDVGRYSWKQVIAKSYIIPETEEMYAICFIKDITDEKNYENVCTQNALLKAEIEHRKQLDAQNERFEIIVRQTDADVVEWTKKDGYIYISPRLSDRFYTSADSNGLLSEVIHPDDVENYAKFKNALLEHTPFAEIICRAMKKDGEYIWVRISSSNFYDENGNICRHVSTILDVNAQTKAYSDLKFRANHDKLTSLENRDRFCISASEYMQRDISANYAIIVLDINKFRIINDVYGRKTGDGILCYIAESMQKFVTDGCICRMYSDNFAILLKYTDKDDIISVINSITDSLKKYPLDISIMLSYGVYIVEDTTLPISTMCDWAGYAKKTVKGSALGSIAFYDERLRENMLEDKAIESEMEYALKHDQFRLYLQPKVDISTSRVIGAEALVRWIHPTKGLIAPARFIPLFERNSFIINMDIYIWEQVCKLIRKWIDEGKTPVPISINVSRLHIVDPTLKSTLISLTDKYSIPHNLLELEITETAFFDNISAIQKCISELKQVGFTVSMDDFGSGYSSLNMLKEVPVDTLKIDRGFLNEIVSTQKGKIVISHTIAMANELNLNVVSEGVETVEQAEFLLKNGCKTAQGFLYSKPLSIQNYELYAYNTKAHSPLPFHFRNPLRFN